MSRTQCTCSHLPECIVSYDDLSTLDGKDCVFYAACILWKECTDIKKLKTPEVTLNSPSRCSF